MPKLTSFGFFLWTCLVFFVGVRHDELRDYFLHLCSIVFSSSINEALESLIKGKEDSWRFFSQTETTSLYGFCVSWLPSAIADKLASFTTIIPIKQLSNFSLISTTIIYALCLKLAWIFRPRLFNWKPVATVEEILMFPDKSQKNLRKIVKILDNARYSMDVCVFTITNDSIEEALLKAHSRGVEVRIISDDLQMKVKGCELAKLSRAGIDVKHDSNFSKFMHHKFCIVDDYLLLTGSFNWTAAAWQKNNENLIVLSGREVVQEYQEEFDNLWSGFPSLHKRRKKSVVGKICGRFAFWA